MVQLSRFLGLFCAAKLEPSRQDSLINQAAFAKERNATLWVTLLLLLADLPFRQDLSSEKCEYWRLLLTIIRD